MMTSKQKLECGKPLPKIEPTHIRELVEEVIKERSDAPCTPQELRTLLSLTDVTTLQPTDTKSSVRTLCSQLLNAAPEFPAAVCIPGDTAQAAVEALVNSSIRVATVVNFPLGQSPLASVLEETRIAIQRGVDEIDLVFPLNRYLSGEDQDALIEFVSEISELCHQNDRYLKTIIQSDELEDSEDPYQSEALQRIAEVAFIAYSGGSDMVKTSTGKGTGGASLASAAVIAGVASHLSKHSNYTQLIGHSPGAKYSGGVSDPSVAYRYVLLQSRVTGDESQSLDVIRFGSSSLHRAIFSALGLTPLSIDNDIETRYATSQY